MASTYSTNLALELIGNNDQAGSWGNTTNNNLGTLIEQAVSGYVTQAVATGTDTTITIPNGATGVARNMYIELTGTGGTNTNLIVPANKKLYFIFNNSTGAVTVKVSGQTGVSVPAAAKMSLVCNGTDVVSAVTYFAALSSASLTLSGNLTLNGGTINGVAYLNGSKALTSGSALVFDGTNLGIGTSSPDVKLRVDAASPTRGIVETVRGTGSTGSQICVSQDGVADWAIGQPAGANAFAFFSGRSPGADGTERMRLDSSGNLGIGTSSPASLLEVRGTFGTATTAATISNGSASAASNIARMDFRLVNTFGGLERSAAIWGLNPNAAANNGGALVFGVSANGTATTPSEVARFDQAGNLGIGTSSPQARLEVFADTDATVSARVSQSNLGSSAIASLRLDTQGNSWSIRSGRNGGYLSFHDAAGERARFDSSGNLGIGTSSPGARLDVRSAVGAQIHATVTDATSAGGIRTFNSGGVGFYALTYGPSYSGGSIGSVGPNGLALIQTGNAPLMLTTDIGISQPLLFGTNGTERARLDSSGNLIVGTTASTHRLQAEVASGADRDIFIASVAGASNGFRVQWNHASLRLHISMNNIPTSSAGLPGGTVWNDAGTLKIT